MIPAASKTKLTYDDYCLIPDDGKRHEIIDGGHYVSPAPGFKHQQVLANLHLILGSFVRSAGIGKILFAPFDVVLSEHNVLQPDILFVATDRVEIITQKNIQGAPDLVIEVLSEGYRRHDEITKRNLYERFGVKEYWIVDAELETVKIYRLEDGVYGAPVLRSRENSDSLNSPLLPEFECALEEVFTL